jgi:lipoprotein NlpI
MNFWLAALLVVGQAEKTSDAAQAERDRRIATLSAAIAGSARSLRLHSERGDLYFQSGRFADALADYRKMVELDPKVDVTHWRLGIALYYVGQYDESAKQFEKYQTIDDVDRENGLWRYLAMQRKLGTKHAREKLIPYAKADRPPFVEVYRMFEGKLAPEEFSKSIPNDDGKARFYADLYLGLYYGSEENFDLAKKHLKAAEENAWGKNSDGGPGWMWHVARIHAGEIARRAAKAKTDAARKK